MNQAPKKGIMDAIKLVGMGLLTGEIPDEDEAPPAGPGVTITVGNPSCPKCDGEGKIVRGGVVRPCSCVEGGLR